MLAIKVINIYALISGDCDETYLLFVSMRLCDSIYFQYKLKIDGWNLIVAILCGVKA